MKKLHFKKLQERAERLDQFRRMNIIPVRCTVTKRQWLAGLKPGRAEWVIRHAMWRAQAGLSPTVSYLNEKNPRLALELARRVCNGEVTEEEILNPPAPEPAREPAFIPVPQIKKGPVRGPDGRFLKKDK